MGYDEQTWESFNTFAEDSPEFLHKYWLEQIGIWHKREQAILRMKNQNEELSNHIQLQRTIHRDKDFKIKEQSRKIDEQAKRIEELERLGKQAGKKRTHEETLNTSDIIK